MRVRFGSFDLDSDRHELVRDGESVHLPPKALQLLEILIERRPKAISQDELYDILWPDTFVEKTNLHNLVYQLRAALEDERHEVIRTVYGFGFSFGAPAVDGKPPSPAAWQLIIGDHEYDLLDGENLVGREKNATVRIDAPSISRHHARIVVTTAGVALEDLGSKNGTFVEGRRIHSVDSVADGEQILFGTVMARLRAVRPSLPTVTVL